MLPASPTNLERDQTTHSTTAPLRIATEMPPRAFRCPLAALLLLGVSVGEALAQDASGSSSSSSSLPATCGADVALDALSSDDVCGSYCASYEPCAVLNSAGLTCESDGSVLGDTSDCVVNDACAVACAQYSSLSFTVYVPFGSYQSEEEIAERAVDNDSYQIYIDTLYGSADGYFYLNDDLLDTVGTVELNPYTSSVYVHHRSTSRISNEVRTHRCLCSSG